MGDLTSSPRSREPSHPWSNTAVVVYGGAQRKILESTHNKTQLRWHSWIRYKCSKR